MSLPESLIKSGHRPILCIRSVRGAGLAEYIILGNLVVLAVLGLVSLFGDNLRAVAASAANSLAGTDGVPASREASASDFRSSSRALSNSDSGSDLSSSSQALSGSGNAGQQGAATGSGLKSNSAWLDHKVNQARNSLAVREGRGGAGDSYNYLQPRFTLDCLWGPCAATPIYPSRESPRGKPGHLVASSSEMSSTIYTSFRADNGWKSEYPFEIEKGKSFHLELESEYPAEYGLRMTITSSNGRTRTFTQADGTRLNSSSLVSDGGTYRVKIAPMTTWTSVFVPATGGGFLSPSDDGHWENQTLDKGEVSVRLVLD